MTGSSSWPPPATGIAATSGSPRTCEASASAADPVWIASYPKSGNTWMRALLTQHHWGNFGLLSRMTLYDVSHDLDLSVKHHRGPCYIKTHSLPSGKMGRAIYMTRDPRDVCVSYAHHRACSQKDAAATMMTPGYCNVREEVTGSWRENVDAWSSRDHALVVAYEDLLDAPMAQFSRVLEWLGEPLDGLEHTVAACSFDRMREWEDRRGFEEKPPLARSFFRRGITGSWRDELDPEIAAMLEPLLDK